MGNFSAMAVADAAGTCDGTVTASAEADAVAAGVAVAEELAITSASRLEVSAAPLRAGTTSSARTIPDKPDGTVLR
jgi:hypothetical protein